MLIAQCLVVCIFSFVVLRRSQRAISTAVKHETHARLHHIRQLRNIEREMSAGMPGDPTFGSTLKEARNPIVVRMAIHFGTIVLLVLACGSVAKVIPGGALGDADGATRSKVLLALLVVHGVIGAASSEKIVKSVSNEFLLYLRAKRRFADLISLSEEDRRQYEAQSDTEADIPLPAKNAIIAWYSLIAASTFCTGVVNFRSYCQEAAAGNGFARLVFKCLMWKYHEAPLQEMHAVSRDFDQRRCWALTPLEIWARVRLRDAGWESDLPTGDVLSAFMFGEVPQKDPGGLRLAYRKIADSGISVGQVLDELEVARLGKGRFSRRTAERSPVEKRFQIVSVEGAEKVPIRQVNASDAGRAVIVRKAHWQQMKSVAVVDWFDDEMQVVAAEPRWALHGVIPRRSFLVRLKYSEWDVLGEQDRLYCQLSPGTLATGPIPGGSDFGSGGRPLSN